MPYPCVESTDEFDVGPYRVRWWVNEDPEVKGTEEYDNTGLRILAQAGKDMQLVQFAQYLAGFDHLNAVHVMHRETGTGAVIYVNWP